MPTDPNFALYPHTRTEIAVLSGRVDGYPVEEHRLDLQLTQHPVESGATLTDNAVKGQEKLRLQGWVSDLQAAPGNELSNDRAADTWAAIVELFIAREPIEVVTALRVYRNMVIKRAVAPVDKMTGRALRFTLDLAQVLFASTEITPVGPDAVDPEGPAADRTSTVDAGDKAAPTVDPPPPTDRVEILQQRI